SLAIGASLVSRLGGKWERVGAFAAFASFLGATLDAIEKTLLLQDRNTTLVLSSRSRSGHPSSVGSAASGNALGRSRRSRAFSGQRWTRSKRRSCSKIGTRRSSYLLARDRGIPRQSARRQVGTRWGVRGVRELSRGNAGRDRKDALAPRSEHDARPIFSLGMGASLVSRLGGKWERVGAFAAFASFLGATLDAIEKTLLL